LLLALLVSACSESPPQEVLPPDDVTLDAADAADALDVGDIGRDDTLDVVADAVKDVAVTAPDGAQPCGDGGRCPAGLFCASGRCVRDTGPCEGGCANDSRCVAGAGRCTPFNPGETAAACTRTSTSPLPATGRATAATDSTSGPP
jgi:hypothetical protein